jgi:membrane associated rhomboid family serine protease
VNERSEVRVKATHALFFLQVAIFVVLLLGENAAWYPEAIEAFAVGDAGDLLARPWTLLTYPLVAVNPFEFIAAGLLLLLVGAPVESRFGRARLLLVVFSTGALAGLVHVGLYEAGLVEGRLFLGSVAASAGLFTTYLFLFGRERRVGALPFPVVYLLGAAALAAILAFAGREDRQALARDRAAWLEQATGEQATPARKVEAMEAIAALEDRRTDPVAHVAGLLLGGLGLVFTLLAQRTGERYRVFREIRGLQAEVDARARVEVLLAKISDSGMESLTGSERRFLRYASRFYQSSRSRAQSPS